jgi:hypothetical protein
MSADLLNSLEGLVGKRMPDVNCWQTIIAIVLNHNSKKNNSISGIASTSFLTEYEVKTSIKNLMNSGFKMAKSKDSNLIFSIGSNDYTITLSRKKEAPVATGSMEIFIDSPESEKITPEAIVVEESDSDRSISVLISFIKNKDLPGIDLALSSGDLDWDYLNSENESILSAACSKNDIPILTKLIEFGMDSQAGLMWACQNGNKYRGLIAFFIKHGADSNVSDGLMPLQWAIFTGAVGVAQELIENGADLDYVNDSGEPLLQMAVDSDNKQVVEMMVMHGCSVNSTNSNGDSPLHWAVTTGGLDIAKMLIFNNADANIVNNNGKTPIDLAIELNRDNIVKLLEKR